MTTKEKDCTKLIMQGSDAGNKLHNLKRRRTRERGNITRFVTEVGNFTDTTTLEDYEYKDRLHETLGRLTSLDDEIHELLADSEYDADLKKCEECIESVKRAILRISRQIERHLAASTANVTITDTSSSSGSSGCSLSHDKTSPDQTRTIFWRCRDMGTLLGAV